MDFSGFQVQNKILSQSFPTENPRKQEGSSLRRGDHGSLEETQQKEWRASVQGGAGEVEERSEYALSEPASLLPYSNRDF